MRARQRWGQQMGLSLLGITILFSPLGAATLEGQLYLDLPWGNEPGQIGRSLPNPKQEDAETAGPVSFAVDRSGNVYISDLQCFRVQVFDSQGSLKKLLPFSEERGEYVEALDVGASGQLYMLGSFGWTKDRRLNEQLRIYDVKTGTPSRIVDLLAKGLRLPLHLERGNAQELFIQDNATFLTSELDQEGKIITQIPDERLFWLASRGLYGFQEKQEQVKVYAHFGKYLGSYSGDRDDFSVLGVDSVGQLYVVYRNHEKERTSLVHLEMLSQEGPLFSVPLTEEPAKSMLDPHRLWDGRVARMGPDGAIYVMNSPEEERFHLYRFIVVDRELHHPK